MEDFVDIAIEILYFPMNMNGVVLAVDIMLINESMSSLKFKEGNKFHK